MTAIVVAPRIEDPLSDTEAVASGGWVQIRPSAAYVAGGQWVQPVWSDPVPLVGVPLTFQLDPLPGTPYELRGEIPDGESGTFELHEFRIVTSSASPLGWETLTQVAGPSGGAVLTGVDQARLTALESALGGVSGGASNLASITDMSAFMRTVNDDTSATAARTTLGAAADSAVVHNTGAETVAGVKTFSSSPIVPTPTTAGQAVPKSYVDASTSGGTPDWSVILNKPATFPPSTHTHPYTDITGESAVVGNILAAADAAAVRTVIGVDAAAAAVTIAQLPAGSVLYADTASVPRPTARTDVRVLWTAASTPTNGISGDIWFNGPDS